MSSDQFLALGQGAERYELVDGVVVMSPRPSPLHQAALFVILNQLKQYTDSNPGAMVFPEVDWRLDESRVYAPDVACYGPGRLAGIPERLTQTPDLVIEILSPATRAFDLTTKRADYAAAGLPEYWTIDPVSASARCFVNRGGELADTNQPGTTLASSALPGFMLDLSALPGASGGR